jgi:hypothetical protein
LSKGRTKSQAKTAAAQAATPVPGREPSFLIHLEGADVGNVLIDGEAPVLAEDYRRALATIEQQAAELERLKSLPPTGTHGDACSCNQQSPVDAANTVKPHLRCPACYKGLGGKAKRRKWQRQVSGVLVQRCYSCDTCGAEWTVEVRSDVNDDGVPSTTVKVVDVRTHEGNA